MTDVVIVGGGVAGVATAYYLRSLGLSSTIVEKDHIAAHASGFAYGGLYPLSGAGIPGPNLALSMFGFELHRRLASRLADETGVDPLWRRRESLNLAFDETEASDIRASVDWVNAQSGFSGEWIDSSSLPSIDTRISDRAVGAGIIDGSADVDPTLMSKSLQVASRASVRKGIVEGIEVRSGRVVAVLLDHERIDCDTVVLASGPWLSAMAAWLGAIVPIQPLKGEILRLRAVGAPLEQNLGWRGNYMAHKPDGLFWAGTTETEAGFDEVPTRAAEQRIREIVRKLIPAFADAPLVRQTACLRPMTADGLPVLGRLPNTEGVFVAGGGGRKGILYGPAMGHVIASLIAGTAPEIDISDFGCERFTGPSTDDR